MRGLCKRKGPRGRFDESDNGTTYSPVAGATAAHFGESDTPVPGLSVQDMGGGSKRGSRRSGVSGEKVYLGVRVKMPVRDLLKNIRLAQGWGPQDFQDKSRKTAKEERVKTRTGRKTTKTKRPTKSLEELAIIVEVLEEDLKTSNAYCFSPKTFSPCSSPMSPGMTGYSSDESDEIIPSPQPYMSYSPGTDSQQAPSPPSFMHNTGIQTSCMDLHRDGTDVGCVDEWCGPQSWDMDGSSFFWTQLQREESQLWDISDAELLSTDEHGRNALHKVVCVGKRALAYAIARRMAALNSLDVKDSDGMTALLYAANHNQHLIVADLIHLGASINERNNEGKSCLHLSAEKGYIQVLEVLKRVMMEGVYVDVEATDNCGMSVLQCASVALKTTVCELESSESASHTRLHMLREEQMLETLECLLQMGSYLHTMGCWGMQPRTA